MTNKIRIKELPCFPSIAAVLGKSEAERQLFIAISATTPLGCITSNNLDELFAWLRTPQGHDYWCDIDDKISSL